jgi:hypothetical protein
MSLHCILRRTGQCFQEKGNTVTLTMNMLSTILLVRKIGLGLNVSQHF